MLCMTKATFCCRPPGTSAGAKRLEALAYARVATTIASLAWTLGRDVRNLSRDDVLAHTRQIVNAAETAVNAD